MDFFRNRGTVICPICLSQSKDKARDHEFKPQYCQNIRNLSRVKLFHRLESYKVENIKEPLSSGRGHPR
jgi:uncharacterized Zn finger protein (UPF0148 family)